ncbi:hypothetical protein BDK51DRAFT_34934 [Blyttiomyces helicus]|uniref:Uncharacterized protein n=1 Tax=Blyttiomyces helicus TaxID=388810 RepID=A0A4P9W7F1_9FUNG|nr:hypothetical protein BDK51DRAFT_34934 [Blyttiomyces helicus]|eukprot:RKO86086.1 hypothetical protein BDK51DRAFT_34934 [Blyttiomyces helicus]
MASEGEHVARQVHLLIKSQISWQIWKETEPEVFWYFERAFRAWKCCVRLTGDEKVFLVEAEISNANVGKFEKAIKDGSLAIEIDKIHGIDPALSHGKKDVKINKFQITLAPARPMNLSARNTIEKLEEQLLELEMNERARSIDLRVIMDTLQGFQLDVYKRLEAMEKRVEETMGSLSVKCDRMEKTVARYRK